MNMDDSIDISIMQLADSFFPTGLYTTSNGLEYLFHQKEIKNSNDLFNLIKTFITQQIGPTDCVALGNAYDFIQNDELSKIIQVDNQIHCMKLVEEIRIASSRTGSQLIKCACSFLKENKILNDYRDSINNNESPGSYPVAFSLVCNALRISKKKAALIMLYGFATSIIGSALRLGLIQHLESQEIIHLLKETISNSVEINVNKPLSDMWQFAPQTDIIQIAHENMDSKMFVT